MKHILFPLFLILTVLSFSACKKDKEKDSLASERKFLLRTVWHTTLEEYKYSDNLGTNLFTKKDPAGGHYAFKEDGSLKFTDTKNVVTAGNYNLYKAGNNKYLDITLNGITETYVLANIDVHHMRLTQEKVNQAYTVDGVAHNASKLDILFELECACADK